jgi:hypothetical protein
MIVYCLKATFKVGSEPQYEMYLAGYSEKESIWTPELRWAKDFKSRSTAFDIAQRVTEKQKMLQKNKYIRNVSIEECEIE